jgi:cell division protein FtsQ
MAGRLAFAALLLALTASLAAGLQVREIQVTGVQRFAASEVENALRFALGTPTIATRAEKLRNSVRGIPWVADAQVRISLDGVVSCNVVERVPKAVEVDGVRRQLVDAEGHLLGPVRGAAPAIELSGFAPFPEERAAVMAALPSLASWWGAAVTRVSRIEPRGVQLDFSDTSCSIVVDPARPQALGLARRIFAAWSAAEGEAPLRLDVRTPGRVAVLPGPPKENG